MLQEQVWSIEKDNDLSDGEKRVSYLIGIARNLILICRCRLCLQYFLWWFRRGAVVVIIGDATVFCFSADNSYKSNTEHKKAPKKMEINTDNPAKTGS